MSSFRNELSPLGRGPWRGALQRGQWPYNAQLQEEISVIAIQAKRDDRESGARPRWLSGARSWRVRSSLNALDLRQGAVGLTAPPPDPQNPTLRVRQQALAWRPPMALRPIFASARWAPRQRRRLTLPRRGSANSPAHRRRRRRRRVNQTSAELFRTSNLDGRES